MTGTYRLLVASRFEKDVRKLPRSLQLRTAEVLTLLARNPYAFEVLSGEFKRLRKIRVGDYRLIYRIDSQDDEKVIRLLFVAYRRSVYK